MEEKFLSPVFSVGTLEENCQSREEEHVDSAVDRFFWGYCMDVSFCGHEGSNCLLCESHLVGEVSITHYPLGTTDVVRKQYHATPQVL
jgi:hypothetical protein